MANSSAPWIGCAYLFLQSTCKTIILPSLYESSQKKPSVFKALKLALADSTGSINGVDMLKVHCSHPHLIIQLKFCKQENCRRFLQSYREGALQESLQKHLQLSLAISTVPLEMELKAGSEHLDSMLKDEDHCLECIYREKPDRLRDEEITELEKCLERLIVHQSINNTAAKDCTSLNSQSLPGPSQGNSLSPQVTFTFQGQEFDSLSKVPLSSGAHGNLPSISSSFKSIHRCLHCRDSKEKGFPVIFHGGIVLSTWLVWDHSSGCLMLPFPD
ncbi:tumor necrosis factor receptor type 1-associated DEATH domain protein isoform X1 [Melopsittacus undulatus]|uniref:tumor necrosis factor receptor type 1-associated DEATH domain protein isoform X1 n=1 Tax=Melopsittacus undulatus TaxID=13146 RepID=UPI00124358FF|nr:tumor necrosis factor receptor type 1-associated DEATH domain protein isoform X1 [Melopsittacus undulatus]